LAELRGYLDLAILANHPHPITYHRGELLDAVEQDGLICRWRISQFEGSFGETRAHQLHRLLEALMVGAALRSAAAGFLKLMKLDNLGHRNRLLNISGRFRGL
jgi:hypothetical protein